MRSPRVERGCLRIEKSKLDGDVGEVEKLLII